MATDDQAGGATSAKQVTIKVDDAADTEAGTPKKAAVEEPPSKLKRGRSIFRDRNYEVVSVDEKKTPFGKAVPAMPMPLSALLCLFNCVVPGFGTFLTVFAIAAGCRTEHDTKCGAVCWAILTAVLQLVTTIVVIGWIWSILWGMQFLQLSYEEKYRQKQGKKKSSADT